MQQDSIERIRSATFSISRKGYDKREVEDFLSKLADWLETGGADQALSDVIRQELERVGERTGRILATAHEAADEIRVEIEQEAARIAEDARREGMRARSLADEYAAETRADADRDAAQARQEAHLYAGNARDDADRRSAEAEEHAEGVRAEAEQEAAEKRSAAEEEARETIEEAKTKADQIVEEANRRRRDIETVISDLTSRRDAVLDEVRRLTGELSSAVGGEPGTESPAAEAEEGAVEAAGPPEHSRASDDA